MTRILYSLRDAAEQVSCSEDTIRKAIHTTDPASFPPPLEAKKDSRGRYLVLHAALEQWALSLPDA